MGPTPPSQANEPSSVPVQGTVRSATGSGKRRVSKLLHQAELALEQALVQVPEPYRLLARGVADAAAHYGMPPVTRQWVW